MKATTAVRSLVLTLMAGVIFAGCGGSGGGGGDDPAPGKSKDVFSPAAYTEATSANASLSGIWLMLDQYEFTSTDTYTDFETSASITEVYKSNNKRRELFVITDVEASPTGIPRISGCDRPRGLVINGNSLSFIDDEATYTATLASNTRISGSSAYESYRDASDDSPSMVQSGTFTLIKIAALPANFEIATDASGDAFEGSYTQALDSIGSLSAQGKYAEEQDTTNLNGNVKCFVQVERTYTVTENSTQTARGSYVNFWAGAGDGLEVEVDQEKIEGGSTYVQIEAYHPPYGYFEIDNSIFDNITGTSTLSIEGVDTIKVRGSIKGADEGDAETSIDINLP